ncbi:hypothetical protein JKA74_15765 [Marivirga sp. S37H4]|uniref:GyrI-like small molecule binding domain-containing protein n=1 Tax=Marivirga aurantiaca TaxID=2802615 RepID=A0A935CB02_9BACT|nr:hypothetical protein [Marivirga aurantiaca]MBK6266502.1 hypothetical protein [Marivirga aurantiaca]
MKKYIIVASIIILAILIYYILGGFKPVEKALVENTSIRILGTHYEGEIGSDSLQKLFMQARGLVETEANATSIAIAYFGEANTESGQVSNFIGANVTGQIKGSTPDYWEYKNFTAPKSVKGCIEANILVMPTPEDMLDELKHFASEQEVSADTVFVEFYSGPNNLCVELLGKQL